MSRLIRRYQTRGRHRTGIAGPVTAYARGVARVATDPWQHTGLVMHWTDAL